MGLFSKESCIVCGGKVNALTKLKLPKVRFVLLVLVFVARTL